MPTALTKFAPFRRSDSTITSLDARAIAYQEPLIITTPNMDWIPELHNNDSELRARGDGHFGLEDCFQWPQKYCKEFEYAVCIPHKETSSIDLQFTWYSPTTDNFITQAGTAFAIGTLHSHIVDGIDNLLTIARKRVEPWQADQIGKKDIVSNMLSSLKHDINVLCRHPLTYRDIIIFVAQAQHSFLDIIAFMDYVEIVQHHDTWTSWSAPPVNTKWMGCFTDDSKVCDTFFNAGVPVWLIRAEAYIPPHMNIINPVILTFPDHLIRSVNPDAPLSLAPPQNPASGKAPSQGQQKKKVRKTASSQLMKTKDPNTTNNQQSCNKWEELRCPENPESIGLWTSTFQKANKATDHVKKGLVDRGYWFPESALLITPSSPERKKLFIVNWLAAQPLWISPTQAAMCKQAAKDLFGEDLLDAQGTTWAIKDNLEWRNMTISVASLSNPPLCLMRRILWELYKLSFHYELLALDRVMAGALWVESLHDCRDLLYGIFPERSFVMMWSSPLPDDDSNDTFPCCPAGRMPQHAPACLSAPLDMRTFNATIYFEVMQHACKFYVQCFFDHFGRPPVVPHRLPA
ncbi:hypothetical protein K503DRAFT_787065 [Rhizopogon vinicolor AM-OR11-026]|uniref:Uncharacterized protein n=1 Tax=Rhizopogon vinicolor AM-OR11-026 TaxID=1314800 RepID=A0A1B7MJ73_9AGAM|nr:hypothetical protein K503DRAFT_787065 [Rhizopogon vinicolor AM-OR11-026]